MTGGFQGINPVCKDTIKHVPSRCLIVAWELYINATSHDIHRFAAGRRLWRFGTGCRLLHHSFHKRHRFLVYVPLQHEHQQRFVDQPAQPCCGRRPVGGHPCGRAGGTCREFQPFRRQLQRPAFLRLQRTDTEHALRRRLPCHLLGTHTRLCPQPCHQHAGHSHPAAHIGA